MPPTDNTDTAYADALAAVRAKEIDALTKIKTAMDAFSAAVDTADADLTPPKSAGALPPSPVRAVIKTAKTQIATQLLNVSNQIEALREQYGLTD